MTGISKIERQLTADARAEIYAMFDAGHTVDDVYEHLTGLDIETSRAGVGRYRIRLLKAMRSEMALDRAAQTTVQSLADAPEQKHTRKLSQLLHAGLLQAILALEDQDDFNAEKRLESVACAAKALSALARAEQDSADTALKIHEFQDQAASRGGDNGNIIEVSFVSTPKKTKKASVRKGKKAKAK